MKSRVAQALHITEETHVRFSLLSHPDLADVEITWIVIFSQIEYTERLSFISYVLNTLFINSLRS